MNAKALSQIKGVIFDLDNTLVSSSIDFKSLKKSIGCRHDDDILEFVKAIESPECRLQAETKIEEHELNDAQSSNLLAGAHDLIEYLNLHQIPNAIVTRNSQQSSQYKINKHNINIKTVITRECFPPKPDPAALNHIAKQWQLNCCDILYVGDYLYDIQAANNANMKSCLITHFVDKPYQDQADLVLNTLSHLKNVITDMVI
jgi:HAD superfamily hydrolase (TIGR01549 family)